MSRVYAKPSCILSLLVPDSFIWGQERAARFRHISKTPCPCFRIFKYTHCMCAPFIKKLIIRDHEFVWTIHLISRVQVWVLLFLLSPGPVHNFLEHCYREVSIRIIQGTSWVSKETAKKEIAKCNLVLFPFYVRSI